MKQNKLIAAMAAVALAATSVAPAMAQDLGDYEGSRGTTVQDDLRARGYRSAGSKNGFALWRKNDRCLGITVRSDMVTDAQWFGAKDCGGGGGGDGAAVAGVAIAALIGAALLSHHDKHYKNGPGPTSNPDRAEFERGYRDGRNGSESLNYEHNTQYNDGYNAGHRERNNQLEGSRHTYEVMRTPSSGAPGAARSACARRADSYWELPPGSAVATDSRSFGDDVYQVTVQSGYDTATCTVNGEGNVEGIDD